MTKMQVRLMGAALLALGLPSLWLAHWGALWQPGIVEYLGWSQKLILRPGLYLVGAATTLIGAWYATLRWTGLGWMLRTTWDAAKDANDWCKMFAPEDCQWPVIIWLGDLWHNRRQHWACLWNRHDPMSLWYSDGGEDGPRGTQCGDCGEYISRDDVVNHEYQRAMHAQRAADMDRWLDAENQRLGLGQHATLVLTDADRLRYPHNGQDLTADEYLAATAEPGEQRHINEALSPDCESRYTQGSDPAVRSFCDGKEA